MTIWVVCNRDHNTFCNAYATRELAIKYMCQGHTADYDWHMYYNLFEELVINCYYDE